MYKKTSKHIKTIQTMSKERAENSGASRSAPDNYCEPSYERLKVQNHVKKMSNKSKKCQTIEQNILILRASRSAPENYCEPSYERLKVQKHVKNMSNKSKKCQKIE